MNIKIKADAKEFESNRFYTRRKDFKGLPYIRIVRTTSICIIKFFLCWFWFVFKKRSSFFYKYKY
nr:MAG TPA: hypothetical protein [Caudoviricetes sp.]